ncbi:hypothetical protein DPMN_133219 [Dreissena polymorpha]|uniref:Uncharacterized protein n=1 Tax=Dreissena polymorpha TaxID=45954 RepID=A0A9D4FXI8_DREPO|nr:hypothetical protein DPMN_133219 [Dreissena polymorpha]
MSRRDGSNLLHDGYITCVFESKEQLFVEIGMVVNTFRFFYGLAGSPKTVDRYSTTAPLPGTIFGYGPDIIRTNVLTKFHEDRTKMITTPSPWRQYFSTNLNNFRTRYPHKYLTINVTSRVLKGKNAPYTCDIIRTNGQTKFHAELTAELQNVTSRVFELDQDIIGTHFSPSFMKIGKDYYSVDKSNVDERRTKGNHVVLR